MIDADVVELLSEVIEWHSNPKSIDYCECDANPCDWCERAKAVIDGVV